MASTPAAPRALLWALTAAVLLRATTRAPRVRAAHYEEEWTRSTRRRHILLRATLHARPCFLARVALVSHVNLSRAAVELVGS